MSELEHVNITVSDNRAMAERLCQIFDWHIRWQGEAMGGGTSIHVGSDGRYVALYSLRGGGHNSRINHIGVVVDDLDAVDERIKSMGINTHSHADYEPGRRFYFDDPIEGIEIEVVSYT